MKTTILSMLLALVSVPASIAYAAPAAPSAKPAAEQKVATCRDGKTYYTATGDHRGACSGHGGVATWADGSAVKAKRASSYR